VFEQEQDQQDEVAEDAVETHENPDDEAGPHVEPAEPTEGSQGEFPAPAAATGFDPDAPVATSPPAASEQPGVPALPENEGVEAQEQYRGPVGDGQSAPHPEANESDLDGDADGE
jgi:hypothetical protein